MFKRILMIGANYRLATFLFLVLITYITCLGLPHLRVDTGFQSMISDTDPDKLAYDQITREFGSDNRTIVYVRDTELWSPAKLAALEDPHYALEGLDFVERVDDLFSLRSIRGSGDNIESRNFLAEAPQDQPTIDQARNDALYNPLMVGNFVSKDRTVTALLVSIRQDSSDKKFDQRVNDALTRVLRPAQSIFQEVFQVGPPRINTALKSVLFDDLMLLGPLSAFALVVIILFMLRSWFAALVPLITSGLSITWTFGLMGWAGVPLNILSAMLPSLVVVIGSTEDTHMISSYFHGVSQTEANHRTFATRFMMKHMGAPLLLTVLTTVMGFASNIFSDLGLIQNFAIATSFAILANGVITILFVPMVLATMGPKRTRLFRGGERVLGLPGIFVRMFGFTSRHFPRSILVLTAALCAFFVYHASKLHVTNDPMSYFQKDLPLIRDTYRLHGDLSGMKLFFITLQSDRDKAFQEPENIKKLGAVQEFLEKQGIFDQSISLIVLLCVIFLMMSAMFTSLKGGAISLIPNLIPIILLFGLMGFLDIPLNPGTAMVAVIAIGIAIDGTIHLFSRYTDLCRRTSDYDAAVQTTVREEATPMVATSLALALGFGILLLSNFTVIAQFGALAAATMLFALFANLLITPIIMTRTRLIGLHQILALSMRKEILKKSPLFKGMSNYQVRKAILISELNEFKEGELFIEQGTVGRSMYLILSGEVEVVRRSGSKAMRVAVMKSGQILGEVGYVKETQRTADVRALTSVEALRFDYRKLKKDLKFFPHIVANINFNISCILAERLAEVYDIMERREPQRERERSSRPESSGDTEDLV